MIVSDAKQIVFVHIPKCAGTAVRRQLERLDDRRGYYSGIKKHDVLGELDFMHLPLCVIKEYFPHEFKNICAYEGLAVLRDPNSRSQSSVAQKARQFLGTEINLLGNDEQKALMDSIIAELSKEDHVLDHRFVHFTRQSAYVNCDDRQIIDNLFAIENLNPLYDKLEALVGVKFNQALTQNQTVAYRHPLLHQISYYGAILLRRTVPHNLYVRVHDAAKRHFIKSEGPPALQIFNSDTVASFVQEYYREDFQLRSALQVQPSAAAIERTR